MYGSPDMTCLICKVYKATDEDLTDGVFSNDSYGWAPTFDEI